MANTIKIRRSAIASAIPTTSQLALGELAVNTNDGKLFLKRSTSGAETGAGVTILEVGTSIVDANISASAAIADTKLATISTAGKVSGSAITSGTIAGTTAVNTSGAITTSAAITDTHGNVRDIIQNPQSAAYTLVLLDAGKHISITTGGVTVPSGIFAIGAAINIFNNSAANQTITQGASVTMYLAGTATTGNRTLAQRGICTILCVASNVFVISGAGLT